MSCFLICFLGNQIIAQTQNNYCEYNNVRIINIQFVDSIAICDLKIISGRTKYLKRVYILPGSDVVLPNKIELRLLKYLKFRRRYYVKLVCLEDPYILDQCVCEVFLKDYNVWIRNDDTMIFSICELIEMIKYNSEGK